MTQWPAGWYPDPQVPSWVRYWNGISWTEHAQPAVATGHFQTTPDGQVLASWGARLGARMIDGLITGVVGLVVLAPVYVPMFRTVLDQARQMQRDQSMGRAPQPFSLYTGSMFGHLLAFGVGMLVIGFAYEVGFLLWKQATPGKLMLGLQVRRREAPGPLGASVVLRRWAVQSGAPSLAGVLPFVGEVGSLFSLLDGLWPLWDDKRQALHEKWAGTNVVRKG